MRSSILQLTCQRLRVGAALLLFLGVPSQSWGQEIGTIRGTVVDAQTSRGLEGVQVYIPGSGLGTLSNAAGEFVLPRVPVGRVVLRAQRIGSTSGEQTVEVRAGSTVTVKFTLSQTAISLGEIVVTGTGSATEKRKLGNSLVTINASQVGRGAPLASFAELLQGRTAGVNLLPSGGTVGSGGSVRIRGLTSVSQDGTPLIYLDGVRIDAGNTGPGLGGITPSRLTDLNPSDIDRVEIVKGAAASTLYGTQGSNGVIQIFTKKGASGRPRWSYEIEHAGERLPTRNFPGRLWTEFQGPTGFRASDPKEILQTGHQQRYNAAVGGGGENLTYYMGGGFQRQESSVAPETNWMRQISGRVNLNAILNPKMSLEVSTGYVNSIARLPDNDNALHGVYSQVVSGVPWTATQDRKWGERWGSYDINRTIENFQDVQRFTGGLTADYRPLSFLRHRLTLGLDWVDEENSRYVPYGFQGSGIPFGSKSNQRRRFNDLTVDYRAIFTHDFGSAVTTELAAGAQADFRTDTRTLADGRDFPAPGVSIVSATSTRTAAETRIEEINGGLFFQETVGLYDKIFLTGGMRVDGNSAFGQDFPLQAYPKASVAYNISQEAFWPKSIIPTLKLRTAVGTSGLSPAQFSADQTYIAIAAEQGKPAVTPGNVGDPNLGPEKSQELEVGFDAGVWQDRLGIEFTFYTQRTVDALVQKQFPPSLGFDQRQFANIGEVRNHGVEVGLNALLVTRENLEWRANLQFSTQHNEVTDLGGSPPSSTGFGGRIAQGYPIQGIWTRGMARWDATRRVHIATDTLIYRGSASPTMRGSLTSSLSLFRNLTLTGMADWAAGHIEQNWATGWSISKLTGDAYLSLTERPTGKATPAADSLLNMISVLGPGFIVEKADFLKLREISLTYQLPAFRALGLGFNQASVRLAGRNLWTYAPNYTNPDPEVNTTGNANFGRGTDFNTMPTARRISLALRTAF